MSEKDSQPSVIIDNGTGYTKENPKVVDDYGIPCSNYVPKSVLNFFDRRCGTCTYKFGKYCTHQ